MQTFWDNILRVVAVVGLIAVLLLGAWGIIQLAFMLPSLFSGLRSQAPATTQTPSLAVTVPAGVTAEKPFVVSWKYAGGAGEVAYAVSYSCAAGLSLAAPTPAGTYSATACDTPFNYTNATSSMPLVATLDKSVTSAQTTITVVASGLAAKATVARGAAATTVGASAAGAAAQAAKPAARAGTAAGKAGSTYYPSGRTAQLWGYPDVAVYITSAQSTGGNTVVQFTIQNIGTNVAGAGWTFNSVLPSGYTYPAGPQQALYPGDRIAFTLRYSEDAGTNYNNPCTGWSYPCTPPAPIYGGYGTCNAYGPCNIPGYPAIPYGAYAQYNQQYSYSYSGGWFFGNTRTVNVQLDPYNTLYEANKSNNYASQTYIAY